MSDIRDFSGKNRKFTGTNGIKLPSGTTAQRVDEAGRIRFNTNTNLAEYYDGTDWKSIDAPPTITGFTLDGGSSVTSTLIDNTAGGDATIVISGSNFDTTSATVVFEPESGGSDVSVASITRSNSSTFTVTVTRSDFQEANDPYAIKLTNGSGLAATLASALDVNVPPAFATSAGSLGSVFNGLSVTGTSLNASATDADGDTITYSVTVGSLPAGLSLNTSTGYITGTPSATGTETFTIQAATDKGNSTRQFSITVADLPSGGTITTSGDLRIHTFNSGANFVTGGDITCDILVIGGGGGGSAGSTDSNAGGGGGGGGGAAVKTSHSLPAGTYAATVGAGGVGTFTSNSSDGGAAGNGGTSSFGSIVSATGGSGGGSGGSAPGGSGGSGSGGTTNGTGGAGGNGNIDGAASNGSNGTNAAGGGGGGAGGSGTSGSGGNGTTSLLGAFGAGGGGGGCNDEGGGPVPSSDIGTGGTGMFSGGVGGGTGQNAGAGGGPNGGPAGSNGGTRNNNGGGGGSYGGGGGAGADGQNSNGTEGGDGAGGVVVVRYDLTTL